VADWPLFSDLGPLGALPTAPRLARGFIGVVLTGWGMAGLTAVTELLVSELTTNVVRAATGSDGNPTYDREGKLPLLWVRLLSDQSRLMVEVWDNLPESAGAPEMRHAGPVEESGRGLEMVDRLSDQWGWENVPGWHGKRVWALLSAKGGPAAGGPATGGPATGGPAAAPLTGPVTRSDLDAAGHGSDDFRDRLVDRHAVLLRAVPVAEGDRVRRHVLVAC
jgi:anti-sigma regulatory factor (Ser/Thr protein kinase)